MTVSCGVTVADSVTNKYWTVSDSAGPQDLTSYILDINYGGAVVDNKTQNVSVGEYIPLTTDYGPSDMTLKWNVPGSIIKTYYPNNQTATVTPVTPADLTQPNLIYYWMDTDGGSTTEENVTLTGTLPKGPQPPSESTKFNVYRPVPTFTTRYPGAITLTNDVLHDGPNDGLDDTGIEFDYSVASSKFGGNASLKTVQIVDRATVTTKQFNLSTGNTFTFDFTLPSANLPGPLLDTEFPYPQDSLGQASDSPDYSVNPPPIGTGFGVGVWQTQNVIISETFTRDLLFIPDVPNFTAADYAPLSQVSWGWSAEADANTPGNTGFTLANSAKLPASPPDGTDLSTLPIWNNNATDPAFGWGNPQWFVISSP